MTKSEKKSDGVLNRLVGLVLKEMPNANPIVVKKLLKQLLDNE